MPHLVRSWRQWQRNRSQEDVEKFCKMLLYFYVKINTPYEYWISIPSRKKTAYKLRSDFYMPMVAKVVTPSA